MLTEYIQAAMRKATYEILEDDGSYYGEIPGLQGVYANADSLEECREELQSALEDWILIGLQLRHTIPVVDGIDLNIDETRVSISALEGITAEVEERLESVGIYYSDDLLRRAGKAYSRRKLAKELDIEPRILIDLVNRAELIRVKGIGLQYTNLLERAGIASVNELAQQNPEALRTELLAAANSGYNKRVPGLDEIKLWVEQAKSGPTIGQRASA